MTQQRLQIEIVPGAFAVCGLPADAAVPMWAEAAGDGGAFSAVVRTDRELSIVCARHLVPHDVEAERDFRMLRIAGTLAFSEVGILARLTTALAEQRIPVFAVSTFETDYLLVRAADFDRACAALSQVADVDRD